MLLGFREKRIAADRQSSRACYRSVGWKIDAIGDGLLHVVAELLQGLRAVIQALVEELVEEEIERVGFVKSQWRKGWVSISSSSSSSSSS